jgi:N,N'-diacetyllegionaminate synthase
MTRIVHQRIIAEIGLSHEGSLGQAHSFIDSAMKAGADIVKFQIHLPELESSRNENFRVEFSTQDSTRTDYWKRTAFTLEQYYELSQHARNLGLNFCVSVFSGGAVGWAKKIGADIIKIGSGDIGNEEIIESLNDYTGELIISSGMSTWNEINHAVAVVKEHLKLVNKLTLLQCTSLYPTPLNKVGINVMKKMKEKISGIGVGLSDHTPGINSSIVALVNGAEIIEKHITYSREMFGPDIKSSITFEELKTLSIFRNELMEILSDVDKDTVAQELTRERNIFGRSLGLKRNLPIGHRIELDDFCLRKPAGGLNWEDRNQILGQKLKRPYQVDQLLTPDHVEIEGIRNK